MLARIRRGRRAIVAGSLLLFLWTAGWSDAQDASPRVGEAVVSGAIDPGSGEYLKSAIAFARREELDALVIRLDTPGGLVSTTREIVQAMLESEVPILVYVAPSGARAGSAGVFITVAAHVAAMAPATNIGAAHPVGLGGGWPGGEDAKDEKAEKRGRTDEEVMGEKVENDLVAFIESLAEERGRNVEWAVSAVRESKAVSAQKALELKVIDFVASDTRELLEKADGKVVKVGSARTERALRTSDAVLVPIDWSLKHRFLHVIGEPNVASILLSLGLLGILLEFYQPGAIVPGVTGAILLLLGVIGVSALPVNVGAILLLLAGIALFAAELFVTSYGLLGLAGAVCFAFGGVLLVEPTGENFFADRDFGVDATTFLPTALLVAASAIFVGYKAIHAWRLRPTVGASGLVGELGHVEVPVVPGAVGKVFVHGELWNAIADRELPKGAPVRVAAVDGLTVRVEPA